MYKTIKKNQDSPNYTSRISRFDAYRISNNHRINTDNRLICWRCNPFSDRDQYCDYSHFKHLTKHQFNDLCESKLKTDPIKLREIAHQCCVLQNYACSHRITSQLIALYPNNAKYMREHALSLSCLNDHKKAQIYYLKALNLSPTDDRSHREYAVFLHQKRSQLSMAKKYFSNALKLCDNNPSTHYQYAQLLEEEGNCRECEFHYKYSIELEPFCKNGIYYIALFYHYKLKNLTKSRKYFDTLCSLKYNNRLYWFHGNKLYTFHYFEYGLLLKDLTQYKEALKYFDIALRKCFYHDDKANIYYEIGLVYDSYLKDIDNAKWYFNEAQKLYPKQYGIFYDEFISYHQFNKDIEDVINEEYDEDEDGKMDTLISNSSDCKYSQIMNRNNDSNDVDSVDLDTNHTIYRDKKHSNSNRPAPINRSNCCKMSGNDYDDKHEKNENKSQSELQFERFLRELNLLNYYDKFVEHQCNDMKYLEVFEEEEALLTQIIDNRLQRKYFILQVHKFIEKKAIFEQWLTQSQFSDYTDSFYRNGIYTIQLFHEKIKNKDDLLKIIGKHNELDANILWNIARRKTRKDGTSNTLQKLQLALSYEGIKNTL